MPIPIIYFYELNIHISIYTVSMYPDTVLHPAFVSTDHNMFKVL